MRWSGGVIAAVLAALACGCASVPEDPQVVRVGILDGVTNRPVVDAKYRLISLDLPRAETAENPARALRSEPVAGITPSGKPLPIRLSEDKTLVIEHPHYETMLLTRHGDETRLIRGRVGGLSLLDLVELPPLKPEDRGEVRRQPAGLIGWIRATRELPAANRPSTSFRPSGAHLRR